MAGKRFYNRSVATGPSSYFNRQCTPK